MCEVISEERPATEEPAAKGSGPLFGLAKMEDPRNDLDLFRDLERYEADLVTAARHVQSEFTRLAEALDGLECRPRRLMPKALDALKGALALLQDAAGAAEELEKREAERLRSRERRNFLALVGSRTAEEMRPMERLGEEARLTWKISVLMDRMAAVRGPVGSNISWPGVNRQRIEELCARLTTFPSTADLKAMSEDALLEAIHDIERVRREGGKLLGLAQALRQVARAQ